MRTPAQIAHLLGWPEARWWDEYLTRRGTGMTHSEYLDMLREKLIVRRTVRGRWMWVIGHWTGPGKVVIVTCTFGYAPTQPAALALGLAALETASVRSAR